MRISDVAELLLLAALWGGSFLFMRVAAPVLGPVWLIEFRVLLAGLVLLPVLARLDLLREVRRNLIPLVVVGWINSAIPFLPLKGSPVPYGGKPSCRAGLIACLCIYISPGGIYIDFKCDSTAIWHDCCFGLAQGETNHFSYDWLCFWIHRGRDFGWLESYCRYTNFLCGGAGWIVCCLDVCDRRSLR